VKDESVWRKAKLPKFSRLAQNKSFDVVVIGGGITGLTAAYLLKKAGKKVCLLERDQIGSVDTGNTTAHLTYVTDLRLKDLVKNFGRDQARLTWLGGAAAINTIEKIADTLKIDCEFRRVPGYLHASLDGSKDETKELKKEAELAQELEFEAAFVDSVPVMDRPGIRFANQAKFHPLQYLAGLAKAIHGGGSAIFGDTEASEVQADPMTVVANGKKVKCDYLVIATHVPLMGKAGLLSATLFQTKLYPYSSYVIGAQLPKNTLSEALYYDTTDPYYYLRIDRQPTFDYLIFGGADHKTGQKDSPTACFAQVEAKLKTLLPKAKVTERWTGQVIETNDGLPFMGETAERQFVATGFSGNGMTFGTLGAMMACDAVLGRENPWKNLFAVNRKKLRGGTWDYLKENFDYPYYLIRDRLAPAEGESPADVGAGEGKILKIDGQRVACSRDKKGKLTAVSAICTHMGCVVHWNRPERTWDCPCHGSRFQADGAVMAGPAESPLEQVEVESGAHKRKAVSGRKKKPTRPRSASRGKGRRSTVKQSR
jgi:glycine/D-amino acid oxidase-like deaminating enzyme/Rieske Fe-S protein